MESQAVLFLFFVAHLGFAKKLGGGFKYIFFSPRSLGIHDPI